MSSDDSSSSGRQSIRFYQDMITQSPYRVSWERLSRLKGIDLEIVWHMGPVEPADEFTPADDLPYETFDALDRQVLRPVSLQYGIDQCVGDTICAGGIMYGQRGIAMILDLCRSSISTRLPWPCTSSQMTLLLPDRRANLSTPATWRNACFDRCRRYLSNRLRERLLEAYVGTRRELSSLGNHGC